MRNYVEIVILAGVPDETPDKGYEAIIAVKDYVQAISDCLGDLGLGPAEQTRRLMKRRVPKPPADPGPLLELMTGAKTPQEVEALMTGKPALVA